MERLTKTNNASTDLRADVARLVAEVDALSHERLNLHAEMQRQEKLLSRAERQVGILSQCAELLNSTLILDDILRRVLRLAVEFMQAERGFIALRHAGDPLEVTVLHNLEQPEYEADQRVSRSIVERVFSTGNPVVTTDAQVDPRFNNEQSIIAEQIRSIVCVPLKVRTSTIGVVYLDSRVMPNLFGMSDPEMLMSFANLAGPAIENARLFSQERARVREIQALEAMQTRILETVAGGIITIDHLDRIVMMNFAAERMLSFARGALAGRPVSEIEASLPGLRELLAQARTGERGVRSLVNSRDPRGNLQVFELKIAVVDSDNLVVIVNDLSDQHRIEDALSRYLAPHVVRSLLRNPSEIRLGGERQRATMLFADIRGFTERSAKMRPEAVVELLNRYFERAVAAIFAHDGLLDKFYGDGIMAVFGPPRPRDDDARRAIEAALALIGAAESVNAELEQPLQISIGLASGTVVAGHVGSSRRMDYTVIGDAVNLASRLEARAEPNTILCDEATYLASGLKLPAESFVASIRGREESFTIYRLRP